MTLLPWRRSERENSSQSSGFEDLAAPLLPALYNHARWLSREPADAEDLVQETWMRVLERAGQYNGRSRFEPWLFSIARNLAIDYLRRRQTAVLATSNALDSTAVLELPASEIHSPFLAAAKSEDATRIAVALESLEPIYREALLLRFQEDLSLEEIAEVAGAPITTISSRIHRGLSIMRSHLEGGTDAG